MMNDPAYNRHLRAHAHLGAPFGSDTFGQAAERFARTFGRPSFLLGQTFLVLVWIVFNSASGDRFDPYPFILLNLAFSTQAAYAAPLILLAQTRQADRDRAWTDADARHREELSARTLTLLEQNTRLTEEVALLSRQIDGLTREVHRRVVLEGN
jgi:uncharacterized membrane protein